MSSTNGIDSVDIVHFSEDWIEAYLDLAEKTEFKDPLYAYMISREERKANLLRQISSGTIKAHFIATSNGEVAGSARAVMPLTCGDYGEDRAILVLMISPDFRELGLESRLLEYVCGELNTQNVKWLEMGILDTWKEWQRFLEENGFEPREKTADVILHPNVEVREPTEDRGVRIRPIQLPEDREEVIGLFRRERIEDMPKACEILTPWWELEPYASNFDPEGFLVAEDRDTGELVGFGDAWYDEKGDIKANIGEIEVARKLIGKGLRERLLGLAIAWLRRKGAKYIRTRVHIGYRNEEALFQRLGFEIESSATVWRKSTQV